MEKIWLFFSLKKKERSFCSKGVEGPFALSVHQTEGEAIVKFSLLPQDGCYWPLLNLLMYMYILLKFYLTFRFVVSAWNKHIHLNTLYKSVVNIWWCSDVMCTSKTGPLALVDTCRVGTHLASPNGVLSSQVSLYMYLLLLKWGDIWGFWGLFIVSYSDCSRETIESFTVDRMQGGAADGQQLIFFWHKNQWHKIFWCEWSLE